MIVLGEAEIGKTALLSKYVNNKFPPHYRATIGADFLSKKIQVEDGMLTLQLWDTSGQERFQSLGAAFYRGADCCILVYDLTNRNSFERLEQWKEQFVDMACVDKEKFPFVIVGNKADREAERQVGWSEAQTWARNNGGIPLFETSASQGSNINEAFEQAAHSALSSISYYGYA